MNFSPDVPIERRTQDRLGRWDFARSLARAIGNWRTHESLVIALFGAWGSGKTSLKNLTLDALHKAKSPLKVIHFNPWLVGGHEHLVEAFFRDIAVALERAVPGEAAETTTHRLATLAPYLSMLGAATEHISGALEIAGVPFAGVGTRIGGQVKKMANTTKEGIEAQHQMKVAASKTLVELKDELRDATTALENPLLIVIDDIDRLSSDEVCLLFRLIKANADFPHFIYLILCDRNFVTEALAALAPGRGGEFLEKIVQVGFDVPDPAWEDLVALAQTEWNEIRRASRDATRRANEQRWQYLIGLAQPYMVNARSARRWMNGVRFAFGFFQRKAGFDANPEDVLGIELVRVLEPRLYLEVARRKRELTSGPWNIDSWGLTDNDKAKMRKSLLEHGHSSRRDAADALLSWLFPNAQWNQRSAQNEELLNGLRVGCHACFDRYFRFAFGAETLSRFEIIHALRSAQSYGSFVTLLRKELASGRLSVLLDHLEAHAADLAASASIVLQASFEVGDQLPDRRWIYAGTGLQAPVGSYGVELTSQRNGFGDNWKIRVASGIFFAVLQQLNKVVEPRRILASMLSGFASSYLLRRLMQRLRMLPEILPMKYNRYY